jgi:hypothetical protein
MKSAIGSDIITCIKYGYKSLCVIPIKMFLNLLQEYNENRVQALRKRLMNM